MPFAHLHLHTEYSLLDGACRLGPLLDRAKELGQASVAITDHGSMYGVIDFYRAAKARGLRPVIGCEVYVAARSRFDKDKSLDARRGHLVLLCENETGYQNLMAMVSEAWVNGFYTKPRVDHALLEQYHEGLIALSACLAGEIPQALLENNFEEAKRLALWYEAVFGKGNFFIEIQDHGLEEQKRILPMLIRLAKETGILPVATNDVHYIKKEDAQLQQVLLCIQTNHVLGEDTGMEFGTEEFYFKSEAEMRQAFPQCPEAIGISGEIAARCQVEFEFGVTKLPHFALPAGQDHYEWLKALCEAGLRTRCNGEPTQEYKDRLQYELDIIRQMGYVDYYLIVYDFIAYAKSQGIPVGPARGSGAGSLASYSIGITGIDPMKYALLFERFLNPERVSMPDFDIDFCSERRGEVIDYVNEKYGADHVAQIITFGTMAARGALRDVGRAMGMPYGTVDQVAKMVPNELKMTLERALQNSSSLRAAYEGDPEIKKLVDTAQKVEGMPRHAGTHAAGVVITRDPVSAYVPLARNDAVIVTQFPMTTLEELGLLKIDFLSLANLTVLRAAEEMIARHTPGVTCETVPMEDPAVFEMLGRGETEGVFQFESAGMRSVLTGLKPEGLEDLIAVVSLYRPGPMDSIPTYIENRHHPERTKYLTPQLEPILRVTYGCLVYQEQVMQVFRELAGYSYGRADIVRRAMSKKKHDVMEKERSAFIEGCGRVSGIAAGVANRLFDDISAFASYAFNKSHAAGYALVAWWTAWFKYHYPREYMAALLSNDVGNVGKIAEYAAECARLSIPLLPPSVNAGAERFTVEEGGIRFGLLAVKNLGSSMIRSIIEERESNGQFTTFYSFLKRMQGRDCNRRAVEALIRCGALDGLDGNRREMVMALDMFASELENDARRNVEGQMGFMELLAKDYSTAAQPTPPRQREFTAEDLLAGEKETMGFYISGHPLAALAEQAAKLGAASIAALLDPSNETGMGQYHDNEEVRLLSVITGVKKKVVKNNATMAFLSVEDMTGQMEALVFPSTLERFAGVVQEGRTALLAGRLSLQENKEAKVICNTLEEITAESFGESPGAFAPPPLYPPQRICGFAGDPGKGAFNPSSRQSAPFSKGGGANAPGDSKRWTTNPSFVPKAIYLKFSSEGDPRIPKVEQFTSIFDGATPLRYFFEDSGNYTPNGALPGVDWNPTLERVLKELLGEKWVQVR